MNLWSVLEFIFDSVLNWRSSMAFFAGLVLGGFAMNLIPNTTLGYIVGGIIFIAAVVLGARWNNS